MVRVLYRGKEYEAAEINNGLYYEIPRVGQVPASWVTVSKIPGQPPPPPIELPSDEVPVVKKKRRSQDPTINP